jgi:hypothetical protein
MVAEPDDARGWTNANIAAYIEAYPLVDALGRYPTRPNEATPTELEANPYWTPTYDLNAAAADIWDEKASSLAENFDVSGGGESYSREQVYDNAVRRARYYRARRAPRLIEQVPYPYPVRESSIVNAGDC